MSDQWDEPRRSRSLISPELWQPAGLDELEPAAWEALHHEGNTAVAAGPGAGKTEFLAQRATFLLQTNRCPAPGRILAISYKRDSAVNLARRVASRVPDQAQRFVSLTFDAFTKGLVDRFARSLPPGWQFGDAGYEIEFWYEKAARDFLSNLAQDSTPSMRKALYSIPPGRFLTDIVGAWALPGGSASTPEGIEEYAAWSWWQERYVTPAVPSVDFTMLNRLADLIVRSNPRLLRALRATYPFVFVDEFQDTTAAQITFLHTVFGHEGVVTTAVGDSKQRIMRFAGALEDAMSRYERDFSATRFHLAWNFRSSADLVSAQHHVAQKLEPAIVQAISKAQAEVGHVPMEIWVHADPRDEAEHIAEWIVSDIAASSRHPADFALVARQKVSDIEPAFAQALAGHGIALRNDDTTYGKLRLQDLLKNDVTRLLLGVLELSAKTVGLAAVWVETHALLCRITGTEHDALANRRNADLLTTFTSTLRAWLETNAVDATNPTDVVTRATELFPVEQLAAFVRSQHSGDSLDLLLESLVARLKTVMTADKDWPQVFTDVTAKDAVTLMTIHRSKGLEYHTVFMLGLDDQQWWSYSKDAGEATSTFFVGLSRAAHRVIFTATNTNGREGGIRDLYELLDQAGAKETLWS